MLFISAGNGFSLAVKEIISPANILVFMFKFTPKVMLSCTTDHKDMRYCVSEGTCGTAEAMAIQCISEPNCQNCPQTCFAPIACDSFSLLARGVGGSRGSGRISSQSLIWSGKDKEAASLFFFFPSALIN